MYCSLSFLTFLSWQLCVLCNRHKENLNSQKVNWKCLSKIWPNITIFNSFNHNKPIKFLSNRLKLTVSYFSRKNKFSNNLPHFIKIQLNSWSWWNLMKKETRSAKFILNLWIFCLLTSIRGLKILLISSGTNT